MWLLWCGVVVVVWLMWCGWCGVVGDKVVVMLRSHYAPILWW